MNYQHRCDGMLTLECQSLIKQTLDRQQASEITQLVAKDLHAIFNIKENTALVFCGAAFATEQLLQPKFPIQANITQYASAAFQGQLNADQVLSIGASNELMPAGLQPKEAQQNLLHLPFCLYTNDQQLAEQFENQLMHKGMISPPTYQKLAAQTQIKINHANYMTYMDLVAMMHNHFEQVGLLHLWQIIETALVNPEPKTAVITETHNHFFLVDHLLFTPFFSWSQFKQYFKETEINDYVNWLMAQRISIGAFEAHGLEVKAFKATQWPINEEKVCLGQFEQQKISDTFWTERLDNNKHPNHVLYHYHDQAGIIAFSKRCDDGQIIVHYPITENGIADIENLLKEQLGEDFNRSQSNIADYQQYLA